MHYKGSAFWSRAESADGNTRTLVLSVEDHVNFLDGRKMRRRQEAPRWIDSYNVPGQFIGVRYPSDPISASALVAGGELQHRLILAWPLVWLDLKRYASSMSVLQQLQ